MKRLLVIYIVFSLFSCSNRQVQTESAEKQTSQKTEEKVVDSKEQVETVKAKQTQFEDDSAFVNGSIGLLFIDVFSENEWIIKNDDNSMFASFDFSQEESQSYYEQLDSVVSHFEMFAYKPDYNLIILQCNLSGSDYVVTTRQGESKLITKGNDNYKFLTWAEFLLSDKYLSLTETYTNFEDTPVKFHESPNDSAEFVQFEKTKEIFLLNAIELQNDWIKVKRESLDSDTLKPYFSCRSHIEII